MAVVINAAVVSIDHDSLFAVAVLIGRTGVNGANHVFEIDGLLHFAVQTGSGIAGAHGNVRGIGVVTDDADLNFVRTVVAVQAQAAVAVIAIINTDHCTARCDRVGEGKILQHAFDRDPIRIRPIPVKIPGRMALDGHHPGAGCIRWYGHR